MCIKIAYILWKIYDLIILFLPYGIYRTEQAFKHCVSWFFWGSCTTWGVVNYTADSRTICAFYNYVYCFHVRVSCGDVHACKRALKAYAGPYIRRTCTHDRRRHLVWLPSSIINARHMPRSLIRRFYTLVCPVCLWWHVTAVKAALLAPFGRSISQTEVETA